MPATEDTANAESSAQSGPQLAVDEFDVPQGDIPEACCRLFTSSTAGHRQRIYPLRKRHHPQRHRAAGQRGGREVNGPLPFSIELDSDQPQVLIMHTAYH